MEPKPQETKPTVSSPTLTSSLPSPPKALVSAFQINENAILTIKAGDELIWSGVAECRLQGDYADVILGNRRIHCKIESVDEDQASVGFVKGQRRFAWNGHVVSIRRCWEPNRSGKKEQRG